MAPERLYSACVALLYNFIVVNVLTQIYLPLLLSVSYVEVENAAMHQQ